jgi:hypothetical protein
MQFLPYPWLAASLVASTLHAGPIEDAIVAAMRLAEEPNYSWSSTISDDVLTYDLHGQTHVGGFTRVTMPLGDELRRQLGRSVLDSQLQLIFRGNVRCVIATEEGWKTADELPWSSNRDYDDFSTFAIPSAALGRGHPGGMSALGGTAGRGSLIRPKPGLRRQGRPSHLYSSLRLAVSHPHEDLAVIVSCHDDLQVDGDVVTGTLNDLGSQLLLVRDGQDDVEPLHASGTFKLWIRGGLVTKYQVRMEGVLEVRRQRVEVHQTTTTVVTAVGTTEFDVPDEVRSKLGG